MLPTTVKLLRLSAEWRRGRQPSRESAHERSVADVGFRVNQVEDMAVQVFVSASASDLSTAVGRARARLAGICRRGQRSFREKSSMRNLLVSFVAASALAACGGSSSDSANQSTVDITATPQSVALHPGDSIQLGAQARVSGLAPGAGTAIYVKVDFALQEANAGTLGVPAANGESFTVTYTAPATAGVYHVVASDDTNATVNALITVNVN